MRVLCAPDSFKGSLSAVAAARAMALGLQDARPGAQASLCPLADGGEGTLAALAAAAPGEEISHPATGPQGEPLQAGWWRRAADGLAVVELARASGLGVTRRRSPMTASSAGTGQLLAAAAEAGPAGLALAVGGSATVDGGVGALAALGFRFLDGAGRLIPARPDALHRLARVEPPAGRPAALDALTLWCDVDAPLLGPDGAAQCYGLQKGATAREVAQLEAGLQRWAEVAQDAFGRDPARMAFAGAAGGLAGGLAAALGARLVSGADAVAAAVGLDARLAEADLVLTGEGQLDRQTAQGKLIANLAARAARLGVPVWAFVGAVTPAGERWARAHGVAVAALAPGPLSAEESRRGAAGLLRRAVARSVGFAGVRLGEGQQGRGDPEPDQVVAVHVVEL